MKEFRLAFIYENIVIDSYEDPIKKYSEAYWEAIKYMQKNKEIVSVLIYSNKGTAIVINHKHAYS